MAKLLEESIKASTFAQERSQLEILLPDLGCFAIAQVTTPEILAVLKSSRPAVCATWRTAYAGSFCASCATRLSPGAPRTPKPTT